MPLRYESCTFRHPRTPRPVLDRLDLELSPGHTVLLGPNGAGKSTLLSLGAGARAPRAGRVRYGGLDPADRRQGRAYRGAVSWLPQHPTFLTGMTCREHVAYIGWLKGMRERDAWRGAPHAIERVGLGAKADAKVTSLSGGERQRIAIAQALVHDAQVLLLDEPTVGLDPHQRRRFIDLLGSLRGTVHAIVSTHDIGDLDEMFDEVVVLEEGRPRFKGPIEAFAAHASADAPESRRLESAYAALLEAAR